ncbi:MAG: hypothetical protein AB7O62_10215 [Pirellulales bacterium]
MHALVAISLIVLAGGAEEDLAPIKHQVTGLFSPDREADLQEAFRRLPEIELVAIDYENAEISVRYDADKVFQNGTPEQIVERFDNLLRNATKHTFGIKPLRTMPLDKLELVEIEVVGLDCKGCCLGAYEAVYKVPGVEFATASFKIGLVTALVDPTQTNRAALEAALMQRGVQIKAAAVESP